MPRKKRSDNGKRLKDKRRLRLMKQKQLREEYFKRLKILLVFGFLFSLFFVNVQAINKGNQFFGVEVNLLKDDKYNTGIKYTPYCLVDCHLPLEFKYNGSIMPSTLSFSTKNISTMINKLDIKDDITIVGLKWLINDTYSRKEWLSNVSCKHIIEPNLTGWDNCTDNGYYKTTNYWKWVWSDVPSSTSLSKNKIYAVDIIGKRKAVTGNFSSDVIPSLYGFPIPELAWWNTTWLYKKLINITNADTTYILKNSTTINFTFDTSTMSDSCEGLRIVYNDNTELNMTIYNSSLSMINDANMQGCGNSNTMVFFMLQDDIPINSFNDTKYYIYYGNQTSVEKYKNDLSYVFLMFDDFNDVNGWIAKSGSCPPTSVDGDLRMKPTIDNSVCVMNFSIDIPLTENGYELFYDTKTSYGVGGFTNIGFYNNSVSPYYSYATSFDVEGTFPFGIIASQSQDYWFKRNNSFVTASTVYKVRLIWYQDGEWDAWLNGSKVIWGTNNTNVTSFSNYTYGITASFNRGASWLDNLLVRRFISVEPQVVLGGLEFGKRWFNNTTKYPSGISYDPSLTHGFEVTWNYDINGYNYSYIEHNFTGTLVNYTTLRNVNTSYYNYTDMPAGVFQFRFYANNSINDWNSTDIWFYTVNKVITSLKLINNISWNVSYPSYTNITGYDCPTFFVCNLFRNGSLVSNPDVALLPFGQYNYTYNMSGNANYSSAINSSILYVKIQPIIHLALNGTEGNSNYDSASMINATGWIQTGDNITLQLYRNNTLIQSGYYPIINLSILTNGAWNYTLSYQDSQNYTSSSVTWFANVYIQLELNMTNCTEISSNRFITFIIQDEDTLLNTTGNLEITFEIWDQSTWTRNFSFSLDGNYTYSFCIEPNYTTYTIDAFMQYYNTTDYSTRSYYLYMPLTVTSPETVYLYMLPLSESYTTIFFIRDENDNPVSDYIVKTQRYYTGEGLYRTIAQCKSDNPDGKCVTFLRTLDIYYRHIVEKDNAVVIQTTPTVIACKPFETITSCPPYPIVISISTRAAATYFKTVGKIAHYCSVNEATNILSCTIADTSGLMSQSQFIVQKKGALTFTTLCNSTDASSGTTYTCDMGNRTNNIYTHQLLSYFSTPPSIIDTGLWDYSTALIVWGSTGLILSFLIVGTLFFSGIYNPVVSMGLGFIGIVIGVVLGMLPVTMSSLIGLGLVLGIVVWKVKS